MSADWQNDTKCLINYAKRLDESEFRSLLYFIDPSKFSMLWLNPAGYHFSMAEIDALQKSLSMYYLVLWQLSQNKGGLSQKIRDYQRAFGGQRKLARSTFRKKDIWDGEEKYFSDLALITDLVLGDFLDFIGGNSGGSLGLTRMFAFYKNLDSDFAEFDILATKWLKSRKQSFCFMITPEKRLQLASYIEIITQKQGIAVLNILDTDCKNSLILVSKDNSFLGQAFDNLQQLDYFRVANCEDIRRFLIRGVMLNSLY
jgi:hypothetical protein